MGDDQEKRDKPTRPRKPGPGPKPKKSPPKPKRSKRQSGKKTFPGYGSPRPEGSQDDYGPPLPGNGGETY